MKKAKSKGDSQLGKESDSDQQKKQATAKAMDKGGFDAYQGPQDGEQAGPSHGAQGGWPTLQQSAARAGLKCAAAPSQSLKKTATKVARQIQVQQRIQQQALQLAPMHIFLPSTPAGAPRPYEMTKRSVAVGNDEWEHLNQKMRVVHQAQWNTGYDAGSADAASTTDWDR